MNKRERRDLPMSRLTPRCLSRGRISAGPPTEIAHSTCRSRERPPDHSETRGRSHISTNIHSLLPCPVLPPGQGGRPHVHDPNGKKKICCEGRVWVQNTFVVWFYNLCIWFSCTWPWFLHLTLLHLLYLKSHPFLGFQFSCIFICSAWMHDNHILFIDNRFCEMPPLLFLYLTDMLLLNNTTSSPPLVLVPAGTVFIFLEV